MELGAGAGLPSLYASVVGGAASVVATDVEDVPLTDDGSVRPDEFQEEGDVLFLLDVCDADIGPDGMVAIAPLLSVGSVPLRTLNLGGNRAGDVGAAALAAPLRTNTALRQLRLAHNLIGQAGMATLNAALSMQHDEFNDTLVQLPDVEKQGAKNI